FECIAACTRLFPLVLVLHHAFHLLLLYSSILPPHPRSSLFPYTTLFRSTGVENLDSGMSINPGNFMIMFGFNVAPTNDLEFRKADRKSTRLNSSHVSISYAVFCLKKKKKHHKRKSNTEKIVVLSKGTNGG